MQTNEDFLQMKQNKMNCYLFFFSFFWRTLTPVMQRQEISQFGIKGVNKDKLDMEAPQVQDIVKNLEMGGFSPKPCGFYFVRTSCQV